jgi:hypothetical protein
MNEREHLFPNIWCFCKNNINPTLIDIDDQQIALSINENDTTFCLSFIYASTYHLRRRPLWQKLTNLLQLHRHPWCFLGDFNTILEAQEHSGFAVPARQPIVDFQDWTDTNFLIHLPTTGAYLTWSNGRRGARHTERRLDRAICNQDWMDACTTLGCSTLVRNQSDHYPLLLNFTNHNLAFKSSFKFMRMWTLHDNCKDVIAASWNDVVIGCPMYVLNTKLKRLKDKLKIWNKEIFGNVHSQVIDAEKNLQCIQSQIQIDGHTDNLLNLEKSAQCSLDKALERQEEFWREKARINWHLKGDRNTAFFHSITKIKNTNKLISSLKHNNEVITDTSLLADHVVNYFKNVFCTNFSLQDQLLVDEVIPNLVSDSVNALLTMLPSYEEIKNAVFSLNKDSAPGPDGYGAFFLSNLLGNHSSGCCQYCASIFYLRMDNAQFQL